MHKLPLGPDKAPYRARRADGRAPEGVPGGQRTGRGTGEHPRSQPGPGTIRGTAGPCQSARGSGAHPAPALPRHRPRFLPPSPACAQAPAGEKRLRKEMEKATRSRQVESRRGSRGAEGYLGVPTSLGCQRWAALPSPCGETEARRPHLGQEPPCERSPRAAMTPAPHPPPPPAPPCSCRNPAVRAPGRQPGPLSCLHLPLCLARHPRPAPALARFSPASTFHHLPPECHGDLGALPRPLRAKTSRRCPRHGRGVTDRQEGGIFFIFFPPFIYSLGGFFFPFRRQRQAVCPGAGSGGCRQCRDPVAMPAQPRRGLWVAAFLRTQMAVSTQSSA